MKEKNEQLGTEIELTVRGMQYSIKKALEDRHHYLEGAVASFMTGKTATEIIHKSIIKAIADEVGMITTKMLERVIYKEILENKEIKKAIHKSILDNKTAIAESIYQKFIK